MRHRYCAALPVITLVAIWSPVLAQPAEGKTAAKVKSWKAPRTADGQPDLQGIWTNSTLTPLERPREFANKAFFSEEEAAAYQKRLLVENDRDRRDGGAEADIGRAYNEAWFDRGTAVVASRRTSLVVDPPDGRIPALLPEARARQNARNEYRRLHVNDGPEFQALPVRCILWGTAGPPMLPGPYNNNYEIFQAPGYVAIAIEMIHDVRMIPLDGRPHLDKNIRQWMGDSRGRWEGDTLVVDTTNFSDKTNFRGADENLHLVERFTRVDANTIRYEFTVDYATAFTRPWTAEVPMTKTAGPLYEYACHEGNYSMTNMLSAARAAEKRSAERSLVAMAAPPQNTPPRPPARPGLTLTTTAFTDGGEIPARYTQSDPKPISPKLQWTNVPPDTVTFALIMHDPDVAVQRKIDDVLHWLVFNIPATVHELPEGVPPEARLTDGTIQCKNQGGVIGYRGPGAPAVGPHHHYTFELFALDTKLDLDSNATRADVLKAMDGHILGKGVMVGRFHR